MRHEAIWGQANAHIEHEPRVLGYFAEWYRLYRKSGHCGPKVRLRTNQENRTAGSLSLSHRETSTSLLHSNMTARAWSCLMKQLHAVFRRRASADQSRYRVTAIWEIFDRPLLAGFCRSLVSLKFPRSGHCLSNGVATTTDKYEMNCKHGSIDRQLHIGIYLHLHPFRFLHFSVLSVSSCDYLPLFFPTMSSGRTHRSNCSALT